MTSQPGVELDGKPGVLHMMAPGTNLSYCGRLLRKPTPSEFAGLSVCAACEVMYEEVKQ